MAFFGVLEHSFRTAGHAIATGATALADEVTGRQVQELRNARNDQERRMHDAARNVDRNAATVGGDVGRVLGTTGASVAVLGTIITHPDQLRRVSELIQKHDFPALVRALQHGAQFPPDFFPSWIRRAGGYFPKFAQVLSVRADLIHDREVLEQLGRCLEDMPARPTEAVHAHLRNIGWDQQIVNGVGTALNAGTVAQVNQLTMPDGTSAVVKVTWPDTRRQMETDFKLFSHARQILGALKLDDAPAQAVAAIFAAVGKSEGAVLAEFDLVREARALQTAQDLCTGEWDAAFRHWCAGMARVLPGLPGLPPHLQVLVMVFINHLQTAGQKVCVPEPLPGLSAHEALAMSLAGGESMHKLLHGSSGDAGRQEAAGAFLVLAVPFIGWLLFCKSSTHLAHVDPHPGNFRWDSTSQTLWVLDWGSHVVISHEKRRALCLAVLLIANDSDNSSIADATRAFGVRGESDTQLASVVRGMMNATTTHAAQEAINAAAVDSVLEDVDDSVVPIVRCLATLGGMLKEIQRAVRAEHGENLQLSLASLWLPFAEAGLQD